MFPNVIVFACDVTSRELMFLNVNGFACDVGGGCA